MNIKMEAKGSASNCLQPKPMVELLPSLGVRTNDASILLTAQKKSRQSTAVSAISAEKFKPRNLHEMKNDIKALTYKKPTNQPQPSNSKARWNSSVKVDKTVSLTSNGKMKNCTAKKSLNFQQSRNIPQPVVNKRVTMAASCTQFKKPEGTLKSVYRSKARTEIRISNIYELPQTPMETKPVRMSIANKENINTTKYANRNLKIPKYINGNKNVTPNQISKVKRITKAVESPMSNDSWKSSCDTSFLQREKEIDALEEKHHKTITEETRHQTITKPETIEEEMELTPTVSTPFRKYRSVAEYFNNSSDFENSIDKENTIMCFDKSVHKEAINKKDESVMTSLCDLFSKAIVTKDCTPKEIQLKELMEIREETIKDIKMKMKLIKHLDRAIKEKSNDLGLSKSHSKLMKPNRLLDQINKSPLLRANMNINRTPSPKPPSYKIPRRNSCLQRRSVYKSMPSVSQGMVTPNNKIDKSDKAFTMYMGMKGKLGFLNTPVQKPQTNAHVPDTPAVTSHNLQKQLDKLFNGS